ncbi:hypothetical protein ACQ4LE_010093 [Meloidogyne hapla]
MEGLLCSSMDSGIYWPWLDGGLVVLQYGQWDLLALARWRACCAPVWTGGFILPWLDGGLRSAPVWTGGFIALARWRAS